MAFAAAALSVTAFGVLAGMSRMPAWIGLPLVLANAVLITVARFA